jgi:hypothetical protein
LNLTSEGNDNWEEAYRLAALEVDVQKIPERISTARQAIARRLGELAGSNDHGDEKKRLEHALNALKALTTETQAWKV